MSYGKIGISPLSERKGARLRPAPIVIKEGLTLYYNKTVTWGCTSLQTVSSRLSGKRLVLEARDHKGMPFISSNPLRSLKFINSDINELVLPEEFICEMAEILLNELEGNLILKIKDFKPGRDLASKIMNLHVALDKESGKEYGVLALNGLIY